MEIDELKKENQSLNEIIEVAKQISGDLDIRHITKNVNLIMKSKFTPKVSTFILPNDIDDNRPLCYNYQGIEKKKYILNFPSFEPISLFFQQQEYNQISFEEFNNHFFDKTIVDEIKKFDPEFIVPLKSDKGLNGIYLQGHKENNEKYSQEEILFAVNILSFASIALENANLYRKATVDRMTKLYTHHQFQKVLEEEIEKATDSNKRFSLIIFDIDHFKSFNDNYGHLQGDVIIKEIAAIIQESIREFDFAARYGGEEFSLILPDTTLDNAAIIAERLRKTIEDYDFPGESQTFKVTISLGVAYFDKNFVKCNNDIIKAADRALYYSKEHGRNKVSISNFRKK